jgi:GT2 family glycosyltransferase
MFDSSDILNRSLKNRPYVKGKFLYIGDSKLWVRGVTYGTFRPDESGNEFYNREAVASDFARMAENGINAVRTYTTPPEWLLDLAWEQGIFVMAGLPWEQHVTFLDSKKTAKQIEARLRSMILKITGHPAVLSYVIGNEIPAPIVRWHGRKKVERFLKRLYIAAKEEDEGAMVTYVNYPTTEYLQLPFLDFSCYNVYLEEENSLKDYLYRLQNIAGDGPLILGELGLDSRRNGALRQATVLDWQIRAAFRVGCAGVFVFAWTDEWFRGGFEVKDWDFGLTDRSRQPKAALHALRKAFADVPFPSNISWPKISVIVCTYNGNRTIGECCNEIKKLDYPNMEVIIVDDGSTDGTYKAISQNGFRVIRTPNVGLSAARNLGLEAASGEIVAYIDDDAYPDPHWLKYLANTFLTTDCAGAGGPNIPPPGDGITAACVANSPGGPLHVLISDRKAEHLPGCNMAFRKDLLKAISGFDPRFRTAGDDVDVCWRIQEHGQWMAFSPGAVVWHHRRNSIPGYLRQQKGYGRAEAILEQKWPDKYNSLGHLNWKGRIYGKGLTQTISWRKWRVYHGTWGSAPFQSLYGPGAGFLESWPVIPEWYLLNGILLTFSLTGFFWKPMLLALPLLILTTGLSLISIIKSVLGNNSPDGPNAASKGLKAMAITALLHAIQPLARLYGRFCSGLTPWRRRGSGRFRLPLPHIYAVWSERWRPSQHWLEFIENALKHRGALVRRGGEFDHWDLEIRGGLLGSCRSQIAIEEHGSGKQLIRLRVWPKIPGFALSITVVFALLAGLAAADHAAVGAVILGGAALFLGLHSLIDCAAAKATCHKTICGIFRDVNSEGSNMLSGRNDPGVFSAQSHSIFDLQDVRMRTNFSNFNHKPVHEAESSQQ